MRSSLQAIRFPTVIRLICVLAFVGCLSGIPNSVQATSDPASNESQSKRVDKLIEQLGDKSFAVRRHAQNELLKIGFPAVDALNEAVGHDDLEIAARARFLLSLIHVEWVKESDPALVRMLLMGYEELEPEIRLQRIKSLSEIPGGVGLTALCRMVRFEKVSALSKRAAIAVMFMPDPDGSIWKARSKQVLETLDESPRVGARWLLAIVKEQEAPDAALTDLERYTMAEIAARDSNDPSADQAIVALLRRQILLLEKLHRHERALEVAHQQLSYESGSPETLAELLAWQTKYRLWDLIDEVATRYDRQIKQNVSLLYTLAEARSSQGQPEVADKLAEQAFNTSREQLSVHLLAAYALEKKGQFTWMEREYKALIKTSMTNKEPVQARLLYAEHLHDQGQERAAFTVLEEFLKRSRQSVETALNNVNREVREVDARRHYFQACAYELENKPLKARAELELALTADEIDGDVLISLYRLTLEPGQEADHKKVLLRIRRAVDTYHSLIDNSPGEATWFNRLAWLVGNTEGDFEEAIAASQKSLEIRPGEAGYLDTLAHCYFGKGDFDSAVAFESQAAELDPHSGLLRQALEKFKAAQQKSKGM